MKTYTLTDEQSHILCTILTYVKYNEFTKDLLSVFDEEMEKVLMEEMDTVGVIVCVNGKDQPNFEITYGE